MIFSSVKIFIHIFFYTFPLFSHQSLYVLRIQKNVNKYTSKSLIVGKFTHFSFIQTQIRLIIVYRE